MLKGIVSGDPALEGVTQPMNPTNVPLGRVHTPHEARDDDDLDQAPTQPMPWCSPRESPADNEGLPDETEVRTRRDMDSAVEHTTPEQDRALSRALFAQMTGRHAQRHPASDQTPSLQSWNSAPKRSRLPT